MGAVAAAPFTGGGSLLAAGVSLGSSLAGAGTVAAAVGAGVVGAAAGAGLSESDKTQAYGEGHRKGVAESKAEYNINLKKLEEKLKQVLGAIKRREEFFDAVLAMMAVGVSAANCDGEVHDEERKSIELFVAGIGAANLLPEGVKTEMNNIYSAPPNLRTAYSLARRANVPTELCEEIIEVVIHADGVQHQEECAFLAAWRSMKSAA